MIHQHPVRAQLSTSSHSNAATVSRRRFAQAASLAAAGAVAGAVLAPVVRGGSALFSSGTAGAAGAAAAPGTTAAPGAGSVVPPLHFLNTAQADEATDTVTVIYTDGGVCLLTPYYSVTVPDSYAPSGFTYSYDAGIYDLAGSNGYEQLLYGHILNVVVTDQNDFTIQTHSPNWSGVQGSFLSVDLEPSAGDPALVVSVFTGIDDDNGSHAQEIIDLYTPFISCTYVSAGANASGYGTSDAGDSALADSSEEEVGYLAQTYELLSTLHQQATDIASTFNSSYLDTDVTISAVELSRISLFDSTLRSVYRNLITLDIASQPQNAHYANLNELLILINDLRNRMTPIQQAWKVRSAYGSDPASHEEEILLPLSQDLLEDGTSIFLADFNSRYERYSG